MLETDSGTFASQVPALQTSGVVAQLTPASAPAVQQSLSDVQATGGTVPCGKFPHIEVSKL
jgi:hypothetical protein